MLVRGRRQRERRVRARRRGPLSDEGAGDAEQDQCDGWLDTCHAPEGAELCEWLATADAKVACGIALDPAAP